MATLQPITISLAVSATLDQEIRVYRAGRRGDLARWVFTNESNGERLAGNGGSVESEKDGTDEGRGLFVGIGLEI